MTKSRTWGPDPASWVVLAGVSAALHVGKLSPALPVLREALGLSLLQAGFLLSTVQLAGMALGLLVGALADGVGLRRSVLWGLGLLAGASVLGAWARDPIGLLVLRAIEGLGFLWVAMPAPALIRRLVEPARLSITLGLWGTYMPAGTALALLLGPAWMAAGGWPSWWLGLGGLSALMAWAVACMVPPDPAPGAGPGRQAGLVRAELTRRLRRTLGAPGPWWVALAFACYSSQWLAVVGLLPTMLAGSVPGGAVPLGSVAVFTAMAAAVNGVGNLAAGRLLARGCAAPGLLALGFLSMALGAVWAFAPAWSEAHTGWRLGGVWVFSMCGGLIPATLFSLALRVAPDEGTVATTVGWMQQLSAAGQFVGPPLVAWVASQQGGWGGTGWVTGTASLLGVCLAWRLHVAARADQRVLPRP